MKKNIIIAVLLVVGFLLISSTVSAHHNADHTQGPPADVEKKVLVCKYVGTPGENERLQTGQNPIEVAVNSINPKDPDSVKVGDEFADKQGRSVVVAIDGCLPPVKDCPAGTRLVGYENDDKQKPVCKGEPTGCPYGDQIPVDSPKCAPAVVTPVEPEWELTADGGMRNPETGEVFYGK